MSRYYVVSSEVLPEVLGKVLQAQEYLSTGQASKISEAVKMAGISRGTFYKYRELVYSFREENSRRKAIINLIVRDERGVLSRVLACIAQSNCNVLAINQTIPINHITNVSLTLDINDLESSVQELNDKLAALDYVEKATLVSIE